MADDRFVKNERWGCQGPHPDIVCKTCAFANGDPPFENDPQKANCMVYTRESGTIKPAAVYYDGAKCEYHKTAEEIVQEGGE